MIVLRRTAIGLVLGAALVVVLGAAVAAVGIFRVQGASMRPTLTDGDLLLANPLARSPQRFGLVVYDDAGAATVKRVIGLPGDRVRIDGAPDGAVRVQPGGEGPWRTVVDAVGDTWPSSPHPLLQCCAPDGRASVRARDTVVPPGSLFVLGDNAAVSVDSRQQGFVPAGRIRAVAVRAPLAGAGVAPPRLR